MAEEPLTSPYAQVRRTDRAVDDDAWIRAFLRRAPFGTIATVSGSQPFVNSNLFAYDEAAEAIYFHTAAKGRTRSNIDSSGDVCFSVSEMGRLLPAKEALEFSVEYAGVTVFGCARVVSDSLEAEYALQLLLDKYAPHLLPGVDYRPITPAELKRTAVYRITIEQWSGKQKVAPTNFPGAFIFGERDVVRLHEYRKGDHLVTTDPDKLDLDWVHRFLSNDAYWSKGVTKEKFSRYVKHSLCFGLYATTGGEDVQIGFARVITDFTTSAHIADTFVGEEHRGLGLGTWLVQCILSHPELQDIGRWSLNTRDATDFYGKFGFEPDANPDRHLMLRPEHTS